MKILFCSDGSKNAERAMRFGARIAAACEGEASILGISENAGREEELLSVFDRAQDILRGYELDAEFVARAGRPVQEIVKHTAESRYDLVVIGAACRPPLWRLVGSRWMSPLNAHKIIESIKPPVLVVSCDRPALRSILLCTSGSTYTDEAVEFVGKIARCSGATVDLFHVMPQPPAMYADLIRLEDDPRRVLKSNAKLGRVLRRQKEILEEAGVFGEIRFRHGEVVAQLGKELRQGDYDLVVSGIWPAGDRLNGYALGDVTGEIVKRAEIPVLVIRTATDPIHFLKRLPAVLKRYIGRKSETSNGLEGRESVEK